jgi:hypothetical protein
MRKKRPLIQLLLLLLRLVVQEAVVRSTMRICVGALCKASAASLVDNLFVHHAWTLAVFTILLDASLLFFCAAVVLGLFEELDIPVREWLKSLYSRLVPPYGADKPRQLHEDRPEERPEERKPEERPEERKPAAPPKKATPPKKAIVKGQKRAPRRGAAKALPPKVEPAESAIHLSQPPAQPLPVPRRDDDQGLPS